MNTEWKDAIHELSKRMSELEGQGTLRTLTMMDITHPEGVQVQLRDDNKVLWVNVNGICRLRCCEIQHLDIDIPIRLLPDASTKILEKVIQAWESLPGPKNYSIRETQQWITDTMAPVIDEAREFLKGVST